MCVHLYAYANVPVLVRVVVSKNYLQDYTYKHSFEFILIHVIGANKSTFIPFRLPTLLLLASAIVDYQFKQKRTSVRSLYALQ